MPKKNKRLMWLIIAIIILGGLYYATKLNAQPGQYDTFAQCLKERGAVFYGAFWCPHCQSQKKMFGKSAKYLNYVECSTPDGRGELPICQNQQITGYPTWLFADGSRESGELSLDFLASKTDCTLTL